MEGRERDNSIFFVHFLYIVTYLLRLRTAITTAIIYINIYINKSFPSVKEKY